MRAKAVGDLNKLPITSTTFGVPPTPVRPSEYGGHWLESYQGPRDSYIRAMNQHGDSKGKRFLLKRISKVMNSTNGQSWKVERARIRNRHRGFFRIRIRKFQNSNSNRPARGGSIIRDWKANQKTAIKEKSLAKAKSPHPPLPLSRWRWSPRDVVLFVT